MIRSFVFGVFTVGFFWSRCVGHSAVVINEFAAATNERRLTRDAAGAARVGSGLDWQSPGFNANAWSNGLLPAGYAFSGLATDLGAAMTNKTPSVYLRKEFNVTSTQAALTNQLVLQVQYNDGLVAYLNGREVARLNCGPTNHFVFASEPAANVSTNATLQDVYFGPAQNWLVTGQNVLAIQAHNAEQPSTTNDPSRITLHYPTPEFRINAGLEIAPADTNTVFTNLIAVGTAGGAWKYFVGRCQPSGGLVDPGLLTRAFTPPTGEEDDYSTPSAFSDWLELYNTAAVPVDLSGWSLTDNAANPAKWRFPTNTILPAYGFLVVLCDNREEANPPSGPATYLHTSFNLDSGGGYLGLYDAAGQIIDSVATYPEQVTFSSYGRSPLDPSQFVFLSTASPGTTNFGGSYTNRAGGVRFTDALGTNLLGGLYTNPSLTLYLQPEIPGEGVRYTLDGSEPSEWNGVTYTNPLSLTQPNDKTGIVVRARCFLPGAVMGKVKTYTYLLRQPWPLTNTAALCLTGDPKYDWYRPDGLLSIFGGTYPTNGNIIWLANGTHSYNWATGDGSPFEREAHLEYYFRPGMYPTNQEPLRTDIGIRIASSPYSRPRLKLTNPQGTSPWANSSLEKPSFNLFFDGDFGSGKLDYNLFTNYTTREFENLRLRAGKNDISNPFITDEYTRRLYLDMGQVGARGLFCATYLNGIYRGIFNLTERFREQFFQTHFRSDLSWDVNYINTWVSGDAVVFNQMLTALDRDLTMATNWQTATNYVDIENTADYFLLNIYVAMWDWPGNNFCLARERSSGPLSRFRFGMWDAEGGYGAIASRTTSYNSLTNDLLKTSTATLPRIFRRLATSPEFRLYFADRINQHLFNGGVLDERDPDGAGPLKHWQQARLGEMVAEAGELVKYSSGQALKVTPFNNWWSTTNGRRTYLLGDVPGRQQFRESGFWPVTEPPVFSQHGGQVPPGYPLTMTSSVATTGQTATIWFTLDGSDPRRVGGALNPVAQQYTNAISIPAVATVKARARNNTTQEWSPLTAATFAPNAVPASADNLVIAELMYHPPNATAAEIAAGYNNADDFEFVRLRNIASTPIDLRSVRFADGITFDFTASPVRYLTPGADILVVANRAAFQSRYGPGLHGLIAGEYGGKLANGGERLFLIDALGTTIRDFMYGDLFPWPTEADGNGPSLILVDPNTNPHHADPANWTFSAIPGGTPGGSTPPQAFNQWRALFWSGTNATNNLISGPSADPDADQVANFLEYAFGLLPFETSTPPGVQVWTEEFDGESHLALELLRSAAATNATFIWEQSADLKNWSSAANALELISAQTQSNGLQIQRFREISPLALSNARFIRLRVAGP